jgi:hypothetical protein
MSPAILVDADADRFRVASALMELAGKIQAPVAVIDAAKAVIDETFPQYGIALARNERWPVAFFFARGRIDRTAQSGEATDWPLKRPGREWVHTSDKDGYSLSRAIASVLARGVPSGLEADYHFAEFQAREPGLPLPQLVKRRRGMPGPCWFMFRFGRSRAMSSRNLTGRQVGQPQ